LTADFGGSNPQPDSCGTPHVWYYLTGTTTSATLPFYTTAFTPLGGPAVPGLDVWETNSAGIAPFVGKNNTGSAQTLDDPTGGAGDLVTWPNNTMGAYPPLTGAPVVVAWQSPIAAIVNVFGRVIVADGTCPGAGGLTYSLSLNGTTTLATASVPNAHLAEGIPSRTGLAVHPGDVLYLSVSGVSPVRCASAGLDLTIDARPPAALAISPATALPFQTIALTGTNFASREPVQVHWDVTTTAALTTTTTTDTTGAFTTHIAVPQAISGTHTLLAVGQTSGLSATANLRIVPYVIVAPSSGAAGTQSHVLGVGFRATEPIALLWDKPLTFLGTATSNAAGTFGASPPLTITVPATAPVGLHLLLAIDQTTRAVVGLGVFTVH
jgi:hypothetical protein